ncbi:hypothetical protein TNCV_1232911 [Trichonephila clavipes]|nr:hypothetical protein TNCV_1232911 [Trichonephila clavipes]
MIRTWAENVGSIANLLLSRKELILNLYSALQSARVKLPRDLPMKILGKVVPPKCFGGPPVHRDRHNAHPCSKETRGLPEKDLITLNPGLVMRMTPEVTPPLS